MLEAFKKTVMAAAVASAGESDEHWANVVLLFQPDTDDTASTDISNSGHTLTENGTASLITPSSDPASDPFGEANKILSLDGNSDYLSLADSADFAFGTNFTLEAWVWPDTADAGGQYGLFSQYSATTNHSRFFLDNGNNDGWSVEVRSGGSEIITVNGSADDTTTDQWVHIAYVKNGNNWHVFTDGVETASGTDTSGYPDYSAPVYIGRAYQSGWKYFHGKIASMRITKDVARYTTGFTPPSARFPEA